MSDLTKLTARLWGEDLGVGEFDAADLAERLSKIGVGVSGGWISCEERLPEAGETVQAWVENQIEPIAAYLIDAEYLKKEYEDEDYMGHGWYPSTGCMFDLPEIKMNVTHWQPLPDKPVK